MLFSVPLLAVTTLLQTIIPGVPTPETFVPVNAAARGTDVSLWILQQCPSPATTLAELELVLQLGSSDALVYTAPIGIYAWRSSPTLRAWGRTLVANVDHLLSTSRVKLDSYRRPSRHTWAPGDDTFPNGTSAHWYTDNDRRRVHLAMAMAQIGLLSPAVLTLSAPPLVLSLPAPAPILTLPAPRPILSLPAPAPILGLPAPPLVLSITVLASALTLPTPKPTRALPTPKSVFTQPPATASPASHVIPTSSAPELEGHTPPSPRAVPFCAPTSAASMVSPSPSASKLSAALSTRVRGVCPATTKPVAHSTIRRWRNYLMACLVLLTQAASPLFKDLGWYLVGANYPLDGAIRAEPGRLENALDPFGALAIDVADTTRSGILGGLAPDLFRFCGRPEPVGAAFGDGSSGEHGGLEQDLDPFDKLAIDTSDVVRSGRLSGLAPDLFRFCNPPESPYAALEDTLDGPVGLVGTTGGTILGEDTRGGLLVLGNASAGTREAEGIRGMNTATAFPDIPSGVADAGLREDVGLESPDVECEGALRGPLEPSPGSIETMAEGRRDTHCEEVGGEARGGEHPVDTMAGQLGPIGGDSSKGLGDPLGQEGFSWSDEAETCLANDTIAKAGQPVDPPFELEDKPDRPELGPSNFELEREGARQRAQAGGSSTLSSQWAPQSEGGRRGGYRGGQEGGSRVGDGMHWNGERGGGYGSGRGAYSGGGRGGYDGHGSGRSGYGGGRSGLGNGNGGNGGGRGGGSYRGAGYVGRQGRDGTRRESKASYFFRLRHKQKDAARAAAEN
ncbi:hypothetical protein FS749_006659 [Ceratobasidium sp. UAMH 11750]|nr:hypothetical protein FS749_006659 [Ceratobasidium sp. UAMH 11750]